MIIQTLEVWVKMHAARCRKTTRQERFSEDIKICSPYVGGGVQVFEGIELMAVAVGETLLVGTECSNDHHIKEFLYDGVLFYEV